MKRPLAVFPHLVPASWGSTVNECANWKRYAMRTEFESSSLVGTHPLFVVYLAVKVEKLERQLRVQARFPYDRCDR